MEDVDQIPSVHTLDQEQAHALANRDILRPHRMERAVLPSTTVSPTMEDAL